MQTFVAAMDTTFGGFRTRADATYKLLQAPGTAFLVVAAPERDALREAAYFVQRLAAEEMPFAGLVLNRVHGSGATQLSAERALAAAEDLDSADDSAEPENPESTGETAEPAAAENPGTATAENLAEARIVDQADGKAGLRNAPGTYGSSESPASGASAPDEGSPPSRTERPARTTPPLRTGPPPRTPSDPSTSSPQAC